MYIDAFATPRLTAERLSPDHVAEICRLHGDPEVMRTLSADGRPVPDDRTRQGLLEADAHWRRHGFGLWAFRERQTGRFVGRGGLKLYPIDGRDQIGLAYAVVSELWGRGYATEMARASLMIGFECLAAAEIGCWTLPINKASQRVMEKLGFLYMHDFEFAGLPHRYYRLLDSKWRDARRLP